MGDSIATRARRLEGRRVSVTSTAESEPHPVTGRLGHVHEVYLDVMDTDDGRAKVRVMLDAVADITAAR